MPKTVILSAARTPIGKAYRGALNNTDGPTMAGHVMAEAVKRARIEPGEVEDVVMGCAMQQGTMVMNVARKGAIRAGLPVTVAGTTIDRQCASGLQAIAVAARSVMLDGVEIAIGGGIESISLVQNENMNTFHAVDEELIALKPEMYMSMLETAEVVAERYKIGRDQQDEYSLECQRRVGAALQGGRFNDEIVPFRTKMAVVNKDTKEVSFQQVTLTNTGPAALHITTIALIGANAGDFSQTNTCPIGGNLGSGASCRVTLRFRPTGVGVRTATLAITTNDPGTPVANVTLTGTGIQAAVSLTPASHDFGAVTAKTTSAPFPFTLTNFGTAPLTINNISIGGANGNRFNQSNNCGSTLAVGTSCTINVTFTPQKAGSSYSATLQISDNAPGSPQSATLTGTGQ